MIDSAVAAPASNNAQTDVDTDLADERTDEPCDSRCRQTVIVVHV